MQTQTIWKYPLVVTDEQQVEMPRGARVLCVQTQHSTPTLWALVDPDAEREMRTFRIVGTGTPFEGDIGTYIGTYQAIGGALVFHVFEAGG